MEHWQPHEKALREARQTSSLVVKDAFYFFLFPHIQIRFCNIFTESQNSWNRMTSIGHFVQSPAQTRSPRAFWPDVYIIVLHLSLWCHQIKHLCQMCKCMVNKPSYSLCHSRSHTWHLWLQNAVHTPTHLSLWIWRQERVGVPLCATDCWFC